MSPYSIDDLHFRICVPVRDLQVVNWYCQIVRGADLGTRTSLFMGTFRASATVLQQRSPLPIWSAGAVRSKSAFHYPLLWWDG